MIALGTFFRPEDLDALLESRRNPIRLPASAPPSVQDFAAAAGWRRAWTGVPLRLAARALRDCPQDLRQTLEAMVGAAALSSDADRFALLVHEILERPDCHAAALSSLRHYVEQRDAWPHPSVQGLFVFLATCCARNDGTRSWWDEEVAEPVDNARMALRALVEEGAWRTDAEALAEVREMWLTAAEVLRDRVTGEYAEQLRACKDLSFGDGDRRAEAVRAMADEWRPRMPQIGAWFRDVGAVARALPEREDDPPCEVAVVIGSGDLAARYAARLRTRTYLRAVAPCSGDDWLAAPAAAAVVFVDEAVFRDAASLFALYSVGARAAGRVVAVIGSGSGKEAGQALWGVAALPLAGEAPSRTLEERSVEKDHVDESLVSALRTFVDVGSFDESAPIESIGLQKRPDVCGPVIEALRSGSSVAGLTAAGTGMRGGGKSSAAVLVMKIGR